MIDIISQYVITSTSNMWIAILFALVINTIFVGFAYSITGCLLSSYMSTAIPLNTANIILTLSSGWLFNSEPLEYLFYPLWLSVILISSPFIFLVIQYYNKNRGIKNGKVI